MRTNTQEALLSAYAASNRKVHAARGCSRRRELCRLADSLTRMNEIACHSGMIPGSSNVGHSAVHFKTICYSAPFSPEKAIKRTGKLDSCLRCSVSYSKRSASSGLIAAAFLEGKTEKTRLSVAEARKARSALLRSNTKGN